MMNRNSFINFALTVFLLFYGKIVQANSWAKKVTEQNFYEKATFKKENDLTLKLPGLKALGVPYDVKKMILTDRVKDDTFVQYNGLDMVIPTTDFLGESETYNLGISFGKLSRETFRILQSYYKTKIKRKWDPEKEYSILDFLPPAAQALYGHFFITTYKEIDETTHPWAFQFGGYPGLESNGSTTNCWANSWEYLRGDSQYLDAFFVNDFNIKRVLEDDQYSSAIVELRASDLKMLFEDKESINWNQSPWNLIEPGDLLMFYQLIEVLGEDTEFLAHNAIALDKNIVFEKSKPGSDYLSRISLFEDSIKNLTLDQNPTDDKLKRMRVVVRRFNKAPIPRAKEIFSATVASSFTVDIPSLPLEERPPQDITDEYIVVLSMGTTGSLIGESLNTIRSTEMILDEKTGRYKPF